MPTQARGWHGLGWDLPALQESKSVPGVSAVASKALVGKPAAAPTPVVQWPAPASAEVDLQPVAAGGKVAAAAPEPKLPVSVTRGHGSDAKTSKVSPTQHGAGRIKVETIDHSVAEKVGVRGTLLQITPVNGDTGGPISVDLDYRGFASAFGGTFGQRLRFVQYPACLVTSPDKPECRTSTPVDFTNNANTRHLLGELAFPQPAANSRSASSPMLIAAEGDATGGGGDFRATDLKPAGTWSSGGSGGDFTYSYPIGVPSGLGGKAPTVALNYASGAVDGLTSATNNQASGIGDGWSLTGGGYIERTYKACSQDLGGNNGQLAKGDLCWFSDNATISFSGSNGPLVKDKDDNKEGGSWHPKGDDGSKVERLTGAANGAKDGEYWKVTTTDGTQYFFGLNHLPGWAEGNNETRSTWTEPVFGNNSGEPCNKTAYADSWCQQAWRWNLDYVVDTHGNALTYYYEPETNYYARNLDAKSSTEYIRGGALRRIEYGFNTRIDDVFSHAPMQVLFDTEERCLPTDAFNCDPGQLNKDNAKFWPDVPADQICEKDAKCLIGSPSFFSRKRYTTITTQVTDGRDGWNTVNEWALGQAFPKAGSGDDTALWLDSITQTGKAGGSIILPPTTFHAKPKANRVDTQSQYTALTRNRIDAVINSQGGVVSVDYAEPECVAGTNMPANPESNTMACYPIYWSPGGAKDPVLDWFNKFPVRAVIEDGKTPLSQPVLTRYEYVGGAAWHHDDNPFTEAKYRTWSQWRGYGIVKTTKGQAGSDPSGPPVVTETRYLRGMDGDTLPNDGSREVSVPSYWGEDIVDGKQHQGFARETLAYLDGKVITDTLNDPWHSEPTATDADGVESFYSGTGVTRTRTWLAASSKWRTTRKITTFGDYGLVTKTEDDGDIEDPSQATCTTTNYVANTDAWILNLSNRVQKFAGTCAKSNPPSATNIISDGRSYFDKQAFGKPPTIGDVTRLDALDKWPVGGVEAFQAPASTTEFDEYGRVTSTTDSRGLKSTTNFTPATGGPVTETATTTPPVSNIDSTIFTTTKVFDAISGALVAEIDKSGLRTDAKYDALGRLTDVWKPGHNKALGAPQDVSYVYNTSSAGINSLTTKTLLSDRTYAATFAIVDGLGRTVQTQVPTPYDKGGRVVTDTYFDSHGRGSITHNSYWNGDAVSSDTLLVVQHNAVPSSTVVHYDSAGRSISSAFVLSGTEQWRTTTKYDGDRVTTIPPEGGIANTVVSNGLGQKVQLLQYKDRGRTDLGADADVTAYTYTPSGQVASIVDATGKNKWTFGYDLHDRKTTSIDPDTGRAAFTYDEIGRLATTTDARQKTVAYSYDNLSRKTGMYEGSISGTKLAQWTYDSVRPGLPAGSTRYVDGRSYVNAVTGYDDAGRPTGSKVTIPMAETGLGGTYSFSTRYDPLTGAIAATSSPAKGGLPGEEISVDYGKLGNPVGLHSASDSGNTNFVSLTKYNAFGQVLRTNFQDPENPKQISVTNTYEDGTNRLHSTLAQRATASNFEVANRTLTYDQAGEIAKLADMPQGATADTQCYRHDYVQRLTDAWTPESGDCTAAPKSNELGGAAPYWTSWIFDVTGNRRAQIQHGKDGDTTSTSIYPEFGQALPHAVRSVTTTGPGGTRVADYSYDEAGNTKTKGLAGSNQTFLYDAEGRASTVKDVDEKTSTYVYDPDGKRMIARDATGVTLFVGDLELFVAAGATRAVGTRFYGYNGQSIAERNAARGLCWTLSDHQGTTYATVDAADLGVKKRWQDPFGVPRGSVSPAWPDKHGYLGGYQNPVGLTHLGARDYDPLMGRFISVDPQLDTNDPQSMNGYSYSGNSPISFSDPSGLGMGGGCGPDGILCGSPIAMADPQYNENRAWWSSRKGINGFTGNSGSRGSSCNSACSRSKFVASHTPVTMDKVQLLDWFNFFMQTSAGAGRDHYWLAEVGELGRHSTVCFGRIACQKAYWYLLEHDDDVAGAKQLAGLYCVDNFAECTRDAEQSGFLNATIDVASALALVAIGVGGWKVKGGAPAEGLGGRAAAAAGAGVTGSEMVQIFRNIDAREFNSIADSGKFVIGAGQMEGKWFATTGAHADTWGKLLNKGQGITIETRIPRELAEQLHFESSKLDGVGPGFYANSGQLEAINKSMDGIRVWP
ncbi:RHS repeat-associated core domain-containing protein [Amycolatopsis sp. cg5]|uniref:RHS repeat-associated core domain-containing protein n=1 Tax=Amycolatopsis sp. cg5 TaxID=3238802 RepID=UPI003525D2BD